MKLIRSLPANILESMSQALKAGRLKPPYTAFTVAEWAPQGIRESLASELSSLQRFGFTPARSPSLSKLSPKTPPPGSGQSTDPTGLDQPR